MRIHALSFLLLVPSLSLAAEPADPEPRKVAEAYLNALTGAGEDSGRDLLLGGATMNARLFTLENWKVVSEDPVRNEDSDLKDAATQIAELDKAGHAALTKLMNSAEAGDDLTMTTVSEAEATKLLAPTQDRSARLVQTHPVLAYVARVGKEVYWHPKNPLRAVLAKAGNTGRYQLELHLYRIETKEGPRQVARVWPLRILRMKTGKLDTGWRVLPASDWNAE